MDPELWRRHPPSAEHGAQPAARQCKRAPMGGCVMDDTAILICAHGSRDTDAITELEALAVGMRRRLPDRNIGAAYLEFARPTIREGLEALVASGARRIHALPAMLFAAGHVKNDLPWEIN